MERELTGHLVGSEIHGFHTLQDLDVGKMMEEARSRWLRPNEIHAVLCNNRYFSIIVKPVILPKNGTIVLFDRKKLRNFRKDGHNWKKKKDGKTVKEAHEHLKVGNEERIHVYYAHGQDHPTFVRRCYWLLDKNLEHIVLVHYRETQELHGSPATPTSNSSSVSDPPAPWGLSEEFDSGSPHASYVESSDPGDNSTVKTLELALHDINTLEWDELLVTNSPNDSTAPGEDTGAYYREHNEMVVNAPTSNGSSFAANNLLAFGSMSQPVSRSDHMNCNVQNPAIQTMWDQVSSNMQRRESIAVGTGDSLGNMVNNGLQSQDSFGRWVNYIMVDSPTSADDPLHQSSISSVHDSLSPSAVGDHQSSFPEQIFNITDFSPTCASSRKETKIIVTGYFHEGFQHLAKSNLFCVCGDVYKPAEIVQPGVYRCFLSARSPGLVNLYMSLDGHKPISQVLSFEYQSPLLHDPVVTSDDNSNREEFQVRIRLAHLLFSTSKTLDILSSKVSPSVLNEAKKFALKTSHISESWGYLIKSAKDDKSPFPQGEDNLFELALKNRLQEWLLERVIGGGKGNEFDEQGQGVIHLCAILGYTWAVHLFSWSGLSLDYRDKYGWTALHWAAYCGREKMVAVLLTAGAKPNYVTDPCSKNPGGCTAADLASMRGYQGLAAYVAEKGLVQQLEDMVVAGNATELPQNSADDICNHENANEEEMNLKDTLAAYRTAANAAAHIQSAFREHSLKVQTQTAQNNNTESEAKCIIAALKIQHAYRHFEVKKRMSAAARIQQGFLTWKTRRQFLNMRRQAIKIQAAFRAFHGRRQYRKIIWSVGVVEKAILRWRLKRKGFRGLQIEDDDDDANEKQGSDTEEDFFRTSRKQAEERVERSVVRVQAMFRSKKAQEEYRRMKLTHNQAKMEYRVEYEGLNNNVGMDV